MFAFRSPLFAILFESPLTAALVAGGAVSIPILIHLLNRRRFRIVEWAAMRFLLAAQRKNARRMRLEQLLLLLIRCAIVVLIVLAMASVSGWAESLWRSMNPEGNWGLRSGGRTHRILVIDGSFSMTVKNGDGTYFDRARDMAEKVVAESGSGDGFSVVLMAASPRRIVPEPSEDARKVTAEIRSLRPTHGNADLAGTLATVASLLKASPGKFPAKEVYFLTDLQRSGWISSRPGDLSAALQTFTDLQAKAIFVDVGRRDEVNNLAVTSLSIDEPVVTTTTRVSILGRLFNHGDTRDELPVRLFIGKARANASEREFSLREVASTTVRARRGQQTNVNFTYRFPTAGDYLVQLVAAADDLELDDVRQVVVRVRDSVPALLVNGKAAPELFDRATEWLRVALNPFEEGREIPAGFVARPRVISYAQFGDEKLGDLTGYDVVYLCDVPRFSPAEIRRLEAHVRRGGAVVFSLGERVDLGAYNDTLYREGQGLLPARLLRVQQPTQGYTYQLSIDPEGDRQDPLRLFQDSAIRERLLAAHFQTFVQTEPSRAVRGITPRRVLGFTPLPLPGPNSSRSSPPPGGTAIWEWQPPLPSERTERDTEGRPITTHPGRGRVVLITTTLNSDWNRWPTSPAFPAFMQELLFYAAGPRLRERALVVGDPIELYLSTPESIDATLDFPSDPFAPTEGEETSRRLSSQALADGGVLRYADIQQSGIYKLRVGARPQEHLFAVNVPSSTEDHQSSESNPARTDQEELQRVYPEWDVQVVTELRQVQHATPTVSSAEVYYKPQGNGVARLLLLLSLSLLALEVVLAWLFGHHSGVASPASEQVRTPPPWWARLALAAAPWILFTGLASIGFVLIHNAITGDFLAFLPEFLRTTVERAFDVPPPAPGEGSRWRLEFTPYLIDSATDPWLVGFLILLTGAGVALIYRQEGQLIPTSTRSLLSALRVGLFLMMFVVFLPQLQLHFERQGWPDVVILLDDSQSMSSYDVYREEADKAAADALAARAKLTDTEKADLQQALLTRQGLTPACRLRLAQTLLAGNEDDWLRNLLLRRQVRLHVYRCSTRAQRIADVTSEGEVAQALEAIQGLRADPAHDTSQLGAAVRQVINDFRGSSLAAVILLSDGVTTEGEDLVSASKYAAQMGVPLFPVGIGDAQEARDVYLHDLQVADAVYVNDRVFFQLRLTAAGYENLTLPVSLYEKGSDKPLDTRQVTIDANNRTVKVQLIHQPTTTGEKVYVVRAPVQPGEVDRENNWIERTVLVRDDRQIKVLYVEGYRRYEYHYLKTLLERESNRVKGNKSVNLRVVLLDADPDFPAQDRTALPAFPTPFRNLDTHTRDDDLWSYDVIILGDIDPEPRGDGKMTEHLKNIADFVRERGGGLLVLAGERFSPWAYRNTALKDVLPIDLNGDPPGDIDPEGLQEGYRLELTPVGRLHKIFSFTGDDKDNEDIWGRLKEFYWFAEGYTPKRAAEVLATHPTHRASGVKGPEKHPLVLQHFAGSGRCMFFGFNETWRWNWREDQQHYNQFWIQLVRHLARTRLGRVELRLDRQTPYRRGEPIKVIVRFPDDEPPPADRTEVKVIVERKLPGKPTDRETRTLVLNKIEGSRASFESILEQTPEGDYRFWLSEPTVKPRPQVECKVLAPPGEMEQLRMNQAHMEQAAANSQGKFYTLGTVSRLLDELPSGQRLTVNASGPPFQLWNLTLLFLLALGLLSTEWLLRKQRNLL